MFRAFWRFPAALLADLLKPEAASIGTCRRCDDAVCEQLLCPFNEPSLLFSLLV